MVRVSKDEFYKIIFYQDLDVHPTVISPWPFTSEWRYPRKLGKPLFGKSVIKADGTTEYFLVSKVEG